MKGADWRHPYGPKSNINVLDDHPVVHVSFRRCAGLCAMGGQGPADRGGMGIRRARRPRRRRVRLGRRIHARRRAHGQHLAGRISRCENLHEDGYERTSPVTAFPPNGYGVHDMIGNVWEWTTDWYVAQARGRCAEGLLHSAKIRAAGARTAATIHASPTSKFRARSSRAARICARRTIAAATGRPRGMPKRSIPRPAISDSVV